MFVSVINDCRDSNVVLRQFTRYSALLGFHTSVAGVASDIEAAGCLVDALDAADGHDGVIAVNVAPRSGDARHKWPNGTPFGYFYFGKTLVLTTVSGYTLSLVKKLKLAESINLFDIPEVCNYATQNNLLDTVTAERIVKSQFRSFDFLPRAAKWLVDKRDLPVSRYDIADVADLGRVVWYIDNFNNCKTTILSSELENAGGKLKTNFGEFNYYNRLKDLPNGKVAFYNGSSGIGAERFVEFSVQDVAGNAAAQYGLSVGSQIDIA